MTVTVKHHGYPGHFICAPWCQFFLHTTAGRYRISTVGDYRPQHKRNGESFGPMTMIGHNRFFETMVFLNDADGEPARPMTEIETDAYDTAELAEVGHAEMVARYVAREAV